MKRIMYTLIIGNFLAVYAAEKVLNTPAKSPGNFFTCLSSGDDEGFKLLLRMGVDPNFRFWTTPTIVNTVFWYKPELVDALTRAGADINAADLNDKTTALHMWAERYKKEKKTECNRIWQLLTQGKANPHAKDAKGQTPLHRAVMHADEDTPLIKLFCAQAVIDEKDNEGETPLHKAVTRSNFMTQHSHLKLLLEAGASPNAQDKSGKTPVHKAAALSANDYLEALIEAGGEVSAIDNEGQTPLHNAAKSEVARYGNSPLPTSTSKYGVQHTVKLLVSKKANVNARDNKKRTPLHLAETSECVRALIAAGADVHALDDSGRTPIFYANSAKSIALLLEAGAQLHVRDSDGNTPLHVAAHEAPFLKMLSMTNPERNEQPRPVDYLISAGAKVNEKDTDGYAALFYCITAKNHEGLKSLISAGADPLESIPGQRSYLDIAIQKANEDIESGFTSYKKNWKDIISMLLLAGVPQKATYESCVYYQKAVKKIAAKKAVAHLQAQVSCATIQNLQSA